MKPAHFKLKPTRVLLCASVALLAACGGNPDPEPTPAPEPVTLSGVVADGPLAGATVCYDLNDNAACDANEPTSAATDADGRFSFDVAASDAGKHGTVAVVPATAVDKDTGAAVGTAFTLKAPASSGTTLFVSPLSTLVVDVAAAQGSSAADAEAAVKTQLGLSNSPLANFVSGADAQAGKFAKTVNTVIIEVSKLADAASVSPEAKKALVASVTTGDLKTLATLVNNAAAGTPAQVAAAVTQTVLEQRNLSPATVADQATFAVVAVTPVAAAAPGPFVSVRRFTYTDANNYQLQAFVGDSTPGAGGSFPASEVRANLVAGAAQPFNRNQAYWNKTSNSWVVCDRQWEITVTRPATPASGATPATPQQSTFCGASVTRTKIGEYDVSGRKMADVVAELRASTLRDVPGFDTDASGLPTHWGPNPTLLGNTVFPDGSKFTKREQAGEVGDTERYGLTDKPRVIPASGTGTYRQAATFDDFKRMSGNWVNAAAVVTNLNSVFLDDLPFVQTDPSLSQLKRYRAAFDPAGSAARYFACDVVTATNTSQNCQTLGDGTSSIETRADSRVLKFDTGYPAALTTALARKRQFVERSGVVFGGYADLERASFSQRPNTIAWNALRTALGIAAPTDPVAPAGPGPFETVRVWTFTDAANYSFRMFTGDNSMLDANGYFNGIEQRRTVAAGVVTPFIRNHLLWTGTEWFNCPGEATGYFSVNSVAPFNSVYCKAYLDERQHNAPITLDGRVIADVMREIRWFSSKDGAFDYATWGPNPDVHTALASATFPAGATMEHRGQVRKGTPIGISTAATSQVRVPPADPSVPFNTWPFATTLDEFIAKNPGDYFGAAINGSTAFFVHGYTLPAAPAPEYTTAAEIRVSFDANGRKARFYRNYRLVSNGFTSAYLRLLDTTYTIETIGGKRVMKFAAMPDGFERDHFFERMFAEHNGAVWYAFKDSTPTTPTYNIRINGVALRAVEQALGVVR